MVGRFLLRCLLYAVPIAGMLLAYCGWNARFFPAPHVTNNLAVNEKVAAFGAQGENPEFYGFYRSLEAYRGSFKSKNDLMLIEPNSEFFKYLKSGGKGK